MHCSWLAYGQAGGLYFWEQCRACGSVLLSIFQSTVPDLSPRLSLSHRTIQLGGIENTGNSCVFSVMLQELAALPQIYDSLLVPSEQPLQECLLRCVRSIRSGTRVSQAEVHALAAQLQKLGWQGSLSSAWRCLLSRLAPQLFPLPLLDASDLYQKTLGYLLEQAESVPRQFILADKEFQPHLEKHPSLWRVPLTNSPRLLEEQFQAGPLLFSLRVIHAYRTTPFGKHVVVYRQQEGEWICCNDTEITRHPPLPTDTLYEAIYASDL